MVKIIIFYYHASQQIATEKQDRLFFFFITVTKIVTLTIQPENINGSKKLITLKNQKLPKQTKRTASITQGSTSLT